MRRAGSPAVVSAAMKEAFVCHPQVPSTSHPAQHHLLPAQGGCVPLASGTPGDTARPGTAVMLRLQHAATPLPLNPTRAPVHWIIAYFAWLRTGREGVLLDFSFIFTPKLNFQ